jgi:3',5'-cyclic AMP phosphodiesterase CpdA
MHFVHVGCWNQGQCNINSDNNAVSRVMTSIQNYVTQCKNDKSVDFMVLAGDNFYPVKKNVSIQNQQKENTPDNLQPEQKSKKLESKKQKQFDKDIIIAGFQCIASIDTKKYILFGNHEYNDVYSNKSTEQCKSIRCQQEIISNTDNMTGFNDVLYHIDDNVAVIMIDTTIYDNNDNNECFKHVLPSSQDSKQQAQEFSILNMDILNTSTNHKEIIFIGHHPLVSVKKKKNNKKEEWNVKLIDFFSTFMDHCNIINMTYLCADTHLYQKGVVKMGEKTITQYIVGTGGTDLDDLYTSESEFSNNKFKYIIESQKKAYGYLTFHHSNDSSTFKFHTVPNKTGPGVDSQNFKSKYILYKSKYMSLKYLSTY